MVAGCLEFIYESLVCLFGLRCGLVVLIGLLF